MDSPFQIFQSSIKITLKVFLYQKMSVSIMCMICWLINGSFLYWLILTGSFLFLRQPWTSTRQPLIDVLKFCACGADHVICMHLLAYRNFLLLSSICSSSSASIVEILPLIVGIPMVHAFRDSISSS